MVSRRRPSCCSRRPRRARSVSGSRARSRCSVRTIGCGSFNRAPVGPGLAGPGGDHRRPRLIHRVLSLVLFRSRPPRSVVRGKTRVAAHAARPHARALGRPASRHAVASGRLCPPVQHPLPVWIGVGGTPQSSVRVGTLGLRLMLAIIGGQPAQFRSLIDRYREPGARAGRAPEKLTVGVHSTGFLADPSALAAETFWPAYRKPLAGSAGNAAGRRRPDQSLTRNEVRLECGGSVTPRASPKRWFRRIVCSAVRRD